jgi:outer membrane lipoprotein
VRLTLIAILATFITACSSTPTTIQQAPSADLQLKQVLTAPDNYLGQKVRWGGKIIEIKNFQDHAQIQLVQFPLNRKGRPLESSDSQGRFYVRSNDFLDPEIFKVDTMLTVYGELEDKTTVTVDEKTLTLPVIRMEENKRWPVYSASGLPYNPKHDMPFVGYGYYATGTYSP